MEGFDRLLFLCAALHTVDDAAGHRRQDEHVVEQESVPVDPELQAAAGTLAVAGGVHKRKLELLMSHARDTKKIRQLEDKICVLEKKASEEGEVKAILSCYEPSMAYLVSSHMNLTREQNAAITLDKACRPLLKTASKKNANARTCANAKRVVMFGRYAQQSMYEAVVQKDFAKLGIVAREVDGASARSSAFGFDMFVYKHQMDTTTQQHVNHLQH